MKLLALAKRYDLVVGDRFEMFYTGIIRCVNPYKYYIHIDCKKGHNYKRYYEFTPTINDVGDHELVLTLYDDYHNIIEQQSTTLHVVEPKKPNKKINILCFGDSLTFNGVWPYEGYRRFTKNDGDPVGLGFTDSINLIGKMKKEDIGYEGYGGWKWSEFCNNDYVNMSSAVWVYTDHDKTEHDQESIWITNGKKWYLETIEEGRLKFKRGPGNWGMTPDIKDEFVHFEGGIHHDTVKIEKFEFEQTNPFWSEETKGPNFREYVAKNNFAGIDYVYILLSWNGQYIAYNEDFSNHEKYIKIILEAIHRDYPNALVRLMGIQAPSLIGGITANYGCYGVYSDLLGDIVTAFNYDMYLEALCEREEYKDWCRYIDTKAGFDAEYNVPGIETKVNNRSNIKEVLGTNGVHPTMAGYLQIGDVFYRALCADMEEESKK